MALRDEWLPSVTVQGLLRLNEFRLGAISP
jgi:hypothetical protein